MINKSWRRNSIALCLAVAVWSMYSLHVWAAPVEKGRARLLAELSSTGGVKVDGEQVISGSTVFSDSTISTQQAANATLTLSNLGRIQMFPGSSMKLSFTESNISGTLYAGGARVFSPAGVSGYFMLEGGNVVVCDGTQPAVFTVNASGAGPLVSAESGQVELRDKGSMVQHLTAGSHASAAPPKPLPQSNNDSKSNIALILVGIGAVIAAIVFVASRSGSNNDQLSGQPVISQTQ